MTEERREPRKLRILLAGGNGFIGKNLQARTDAEYVTIDRQGTPDIVHDLRRPLVLNRDEEFDAVINLAAITGVRTTGVDYDDNLLIVDNLLNWARHRKTVFVQASSSSVYGNSTMMHESIPLRPISNYGSTKMEAEGMVSGWFNDSGNSAVCLRLFNAIGYHQREDMFPAIVVDALLQRPMGTVPLFGTRSRDWTYVGDTCAAFMAAIHLSVSRKVPEYGVYNVGSGASRKQSEIIAAVEDLCGRAPPHRTDAVNPIEVGRTQAHTKKFREQFGWSPHPMNYRVGIQEILMERGVPLKKIYTALRAKN
jgi:UDP-glucuronate 4-epimerase